MESFAAYIGKGMKDGLWQSLGLSSPFCPIYLATAALCCGLWLLKSQRWTAKEAFQYLRHKHWTYRRSLAADGLWSIMQILFLRIPVALLHGIVFQKSYKLVLKAGEGSPVTWQAPQLVEILLVTLVTMLAIDLSAYLMHRALHILPTLWRIHRVHHQSLFLTPFTTFRQHPLEAIFLNCARGLGAGLSLGIVHSLLPNCTPIWTIAGMGAGFFAYMFTVNLHHAPIPIRFPQSASAILISPHLHHLHHSRAVEHHDKNFGVIFSFWDRLFKTYLDVEFGLDELKFGVED